MPTSFEATLTVEITSKMEPVPGFGLFLVRIFLAQGWEVCSRIWFKVLLQNKVATETVATLGSGIVVDP